MKKRICVFSGTRAEYGLLRPVLRKLKDAPACELQLVVSGSHLCEAFGDTYKEIEADGFTIDRKVPLSLDNDGPQGMALATAEALEGVSKALGELRPDVFVVLGDRYETFGAASAALLNSIPVAHIHGGELSFGAIDDCLRHAITKLSHLHFASTPEYRERIIQLGEKPERVHHVGALGVENIMSVPLLERDDLAADLGFDLGRRYLLCTFHPETLGGETERVLENLLQALEGREEAVLFTKANADAGGRAINSRLEAFVAGDPGKYRLYPSLGLVRYLTAMKFCTAVIGNSSSGIIEAPSFNVPTLDVGMRQSGRARAESVFHCNGDAGDLAGALKTILAEDFGSDGMLFNNPYHKAGTAEAIVETMLSAPVEQLLAKGFHDVSFQA